MQVTTPIRHKVIALLFTILFAGYYCSNTFFFHVHYIDNVAVCHSHPFGGATHAHSTAALSLISFLNSNFVISTAIAIAAIAYLSLISIILNKVVVETKRYFIFSSSLRAPPVSLN